VVALCARSPFVAAWRGVTTFFWQKGGDAGLSGSYLPPQAKGKSAANAYLIGF